MEFKKVLDQTVREFKREVNKVLKVPEIEQKVLDATSNEPWGPHGTVMGDIAEATRNYNDYQMIMTIIWKRINDTGRNWRHVYKALTLLEFLVAHGSERVIDELKEHAYQLSTLADFQYLDSRGKDQGLNVRRKSQTLVALINDKEKIREVRRKAVENRNKYRGVSSTGGMYKPSSYSSTGGSYGGSRYDEDRYGGRDDDSYGRDSYGDRYRDEDPYGRDWDRDGRDRDRYERGGDRYRDDYNREYEHKEDRNGPRRGDDMQSDRSFERNRDRSYDDDDRFSSRSGGGRGDDYGPNDSRSNRKPSDVIAAVPPSYEEAMGSPEYRASEEQRHRRDGGGLVAAVARDLKSNVAQHGMASAVPKQPTTGTQFDDFNEFDPRASSEPAGTRMPVASSANLSSAFSSSDDLFGNSLTAGGEPAPAVANNVSLQQHGGDLFGDSPFKAETPTVSKFATTALPAIDSGPSFAQHPGGNMRVPVAAVGSNNSAFAAAPPSLPTLAAPAGFNAGGLFGDDSLTAAFGAAVNSVPAVPSSSNTSVSHPAAVPAATSQVNPALPVAVPGTFQMNQVPPAMAVPGMVNQELPYSMFQANQALPAVPGIFPGNQTSLPSVVPVAFQTSHAPPAAVSGMFQENQVTPLLAAAQPGANQGQKESLTIHSKSQADKKFETKSSVWADTLSKGLIDLNIGGPKSNPLANIGIDFDLLRTERIKEERTAAKASTVGMGRAMGSGSGLGLAGAGAIVRPAAPVMMSTLGMGPGVGTMNVGMGTGTGMAMANAMPMMPMGGMATRPSVGMGPGMGMGMGMNSAMGMNMGGFPNQQQQYNGYR